MAVAQSWPQKPIMLIVPFASGGGTDAFARPLAMQLDPQLGVRVLIDGRRWHSGAAAIQHVPYRSAGPMMQDLLAAHVDRVARISVPACRL